MRQNSKVGGHRGYQFDTAKAFFHGYTLKLNS